MGRLLGPITCLSHKDGGILLSALLKDTTSKLAGLLFTLSLCALRQAGKLWIPFFKVFCYDSTWGMNPRSTDCEADALTTTPLRRLKMMVNDSKGENLTTKLISELSAARM